MEFFTQDDLIVTISSAMAAPNFKILSHRFSKVHNFGHSRMGKHCRLVVEIEDIENGQYSLSFIAKFMPENEEYKTYVTANDSFEKEAYFYSHIIPIIEPLLPSEKHLPIPRCHFCRAGNTKSRESESSLSSEASVIIFQDLYPLGFIPMNMWIPLDLPHCRVVMRALAIFHGGSVLLQQFEDNSSEHKDVNEAIHSMKETVFVLDEDAVSNKMLHAAAETTATVVCHLWPEKYPKEQFYDRLLDILWNSFRNVYTMLHPTSTHQSVLCHGELCGNNILFAYEKETQGEQMPVDVKFIHMQQLRYGPPTTDILTFLHVCTDRSFRQRHLPELLSYYQKEFSRAVSPKVASKTLSLKELQTSTRDMREFGLVAGIYLIPVFLEHSPTRASTSSFIFNDEVLSQIRSLHGRRNSFRRYSLSEPASEQPENVHSLLENQSERILNTMNANHIFRIRLEESYVEYLEFVGLWESSSPD